MPDKAHRLGPSGAFGNQEAISQYAFLTIIRGALRREAGCLAGHSGGRQAAFSSYGSCTYTQERKIPLSADVNKHLPAGVKVQSVCGGVCVGWLHGASGGGSNRGGVYLSVTMVFVHVHVSLHC